jgi:hypothetical protein
MTKDVMVDLYGNSQRGCHGVELAQGKKKRKTVGETEEKGRSRYLDRVRASHRAETESKTTILKFKWKVFG